MTGRWSRVRRGVYVITGAPASYEQAVLAAILAVNRPAWASHHTAARLYGLPLPPPPAIELVSDRSCSMRLVGIVAHRSSQLPTPDLGRWRGVPILSPARVLVDLSGELTAKEFGRLIDRAERDGLCSISSVARCAQRLGEGPGRSLLTVSAALGLRLPGYGPGDSDLEQEALLAISAAGLPLPVRHHRVRLDGRNYEIDLAYPEQRIAIELLGFRDHGHRSALDYDSERTRRMVVHGWTTLPFTSVSSEAELIGDVSRLLRLRSA